MDGVLLYLKMNRYHFLKREIIYIEVLELLVIIEIPSIHSFIYLVPSTNNAFDSFHVL